MLLNLFQIEPKFINISYSNIENFYDVSSIALSTEVKFKTGFMLNSEDINYHRPHQALDYKTPSDLYF